MNKKTLFSCLGAVAVALTTGAAFAQNANEDAIRHRQSAYDFAAWNMGKISAQVVDGSVPYNKEQVQAAADAISAVANSGMSALYPAGSDKGTGWKPTRLKSNFFNELDKVGPIAKNFADESRKLQEVAATGDQDKIKAQFGEVGKTCKSCHDGYRTEAK